jgi:hypothetical protein
MSDEATIFEPRENHNFMQDSIVISLIVDLEIFGHDKQLQFLQLRL